MILGIVYNKFHSGSNSPTFTTIVHYVVSYQSARNIYFRFYSLELLLMDTNLIEIQYLLQLLLQICLASKFDHVTIVHLIQLFFVTFVFFQKSGPANNNLNIFGSFGLQRFRRFQGEFYLTAFNVSSRLLTRSRSLSFLLILTSRLFSVADMFSICCFT